MMHFGIRHNQSGEWIVLQDGSIFWTTSRAVANAQLMRFSMFGPGAMEDYSVSTFDEDQQEPGAVAK